MMLTRLAKYQLAAFLVISISALALIAFNYLGVRQALGIGRYSVAIELSDGTGLHETTIVTYRGAPIGKVSAIDVTRNGVRAELDLDAAIRIPAASKVEVHSASAAGEQYVDFIPTSSGRPYLSGGDVVAADYVTPLQSTGDLVDSITRLASSIDPDEVETILHELSIGLDGSAENWDRLIESSLVITGDVRQDLTATTQLLDGLAKFLQTQDDALPDLESSARHLRDVTRTVRHSKSDLKTVLDRGSETVDQVSDIVEENEGDLRLLLHDLTSTGQVVKTYLPGIRQVLLIYPAAISGLIAATTPEGGAAPGSVHLGFRSNINEPPHCTDGFLPIKNQRAYGDYTTRIPMLDNLYCHAPHDDPRDVRGARNFPCFNAPGRRAASVEQCLGRPIGQLKDPLPASMRVQLGTYRSDTSRVLTEQGTTFRLGESFGNGSTNGRPLSWKALIRP